MGKQSKGGSGAMLLLAGLGVGAYMLFANKGSAQSRPADGSADAGASESGADIPAAPRIVAVNNTASESLLPTGIVSDEEGMMEVATPNPSPQTQSRAAPGQPETPGDPDNEERLPVTTRPGSTTTTAPVPPLISTTLTPKEKTIIERGQLTNELALQRPDLYKAIYIRKHGKNGKGRQALQAAEAQITRIQASSNRKSTLTQKKRRKVSLRLHPKVGTMTKTAQNTGKPAPTKPGVNTGKPAVHGNPAVRKPQPQRKPTTPTRTRKPAVRKTPVRKRR